MEDLHEWEVLPEDGFLEIHDDDEGKKFFSRKYSTTATPSDSVFKNYFMCPSPKQRSSSESVESLSRAERRVPKQFIPVPIQLDQMILKQGSSDDKLPYHLNPSSPVTVTLPVPDDDDDQKKKMMMMEKGAETDQDPFSSQQVFFKKETEFVDMILDSPKSNPSNRGTKPPPLLVQFEAAGAGGGEGPETIKISSPKRMKVVDEDKKTMVMIHNNMGHGDADAADSDGVEAKKEVNWDEDDPNSGGINNIFKWSLTGIGAICSFGVATVCIFVLGGLIKNTNSIAAYNKHHHHQQQRQDQDQDHHNHHHQKFQFHIYAEDKRMKRVVHQATKMNEAISAVRGVDPFTRAHITYGGYYHRL